MSYQQVSQSTTTQSQVTWGRPYELSFLLDEYESSVFVPLYFDFFKSNINNLSQQVSNFHTLISTLTEVFNHCVFFSPP